MSNPVRKTLTVADADPDGISLSQTPSGAGNMLINGVLASGGVATIGATVTGGTLRQIVFAFASDESGHNFTITGNQRPNGPTVTEVVAGAASTAVSANYYYQVSRIATSAAGAGAITVGTNGLMTTPWDIANFQITPAQFSFAVIVGGTINYTLEYTYDDFLDPAVTPVSFTISALAAKAANLDATLYQPIYGWRLKVNSYSSGAAARVDMIQAGIIN